jgi:hypothetical protein
MNNILKYTNGNGHLVMSIVFGLIGLALILAPTTDAGTKGVGTGLLLTVSGAWFVPGAAKQIAYQVEQQVTNALPDVAPTSLPATANSTAPLKAE